MRSSTLHLYAYQKSHEQVVRTRSNLRFKILGLNLVHCVGRNSSSTQLHVIIFIETKDLCLKIMVSKIQLRHVASAWVEISLIYWDFKRVSYKL